MMKKELKISYPNSDRVYVSGTIHPSVRVAMRVVRQMPTVTIEGGKRIERANPSIYIYDTSGPYGDANVEVDLERGLPKLRRTWIDERHARSATNVSQMYYAKRGIITPEMEYVAIRAYQSKAPGRCLAPANRPGRNHPPDSICWLRCFSM